MVSATNSAVDREAMAKAINQIDAVSEQITAIRSRLNSDIATLQQGWVGRAATAFFAATNVFNDKFNQVSNSLISVKEKMAVSLNQYTATENEQAQVSNQIFSLLS